MLPLYLEDINKLKIILGSASPCRKQLLEMVGIKFEVLPSKYAEDLPFAEYTPADYVKEIARLKLIDVCTQLKDHSADIIISGDTSISFQGKMYGKPKSKQDAFTTLKTLCGHTHQCITALWLGVLNDKQELVDSAADVVSSDLRFRELTDKEIWGYIDTEQPMNNAGAYMLQAHGATLYEKIDGCFYGIWGLPLGALAGIMVPLLKKHKLIPNK
eukprot:TRINITY_DN12955_c0_g1_i2.p1 TRINITY_DN12955_c0_g1~~TRINITY_DN12955_c0_g1_i2.p1  ORF type:complete len:215 (+),score=57.12 TRINITY_DN12955_c0_g1_i2:81-725(+)